MVEVNAEWYKKMFALHHLDSASFTLDKKLVITVAPTGAFIKREQNPNQAYTPKEVAREVIASYKEGASVFHVHVRDEQGIIQTENPAAILETVKRVQDKCPDILFSHSSHGNPTNQGAEALKPLVEPLLEEGAKANAKYIHTVVIQPMASPGFQMNEAMLKDMVLYLQERGLKAEFQLANYRCIKNVEDWLIRPQVIKPPYQMNLLTGIHGPTYAGPIAPDPWGYLYFLSMMQIVPQGSSIGATVGGHNWLPITLWAIMLGVNSVRVGMEDTLYMYPHKDEPIKSCAEVIRKTATLARELGREIAMPAETLKVLGMNRE